MATFTSPPHSSPHGTLHVREQYGVEDGDGDGTGTNLAAHDFNAEQAPEPPTKRRQMMLQTMGHQLREIGTERDQASTQTMGLVSSNGNRSSKLFMRNVYSALDKPTRWTRQSKLPIQTPESDRVPGDDDDDDDDDENGQRVLGSTRADTKYLWRQNELEAAGSLPNPSFAFDDLIRWTQNYFDSWHPAYPFVNAPAILDYFRRISVAGSLTAGANDDLRLIILRAMISISILDDRQTSTAMSPPPAASLVFSTYNDAVAAVSQTLLQEGSLLVLQAIMSVQLFLVSMLRYNAASRVGGLAVRIAYHLGLQRCPVQSHGVTFDDSGMRQRVFWSLYLLDRQICPRLGIPLTINDDHVDVCLPGYERHRHANDGGSGDHRDTRLDFLVLLARNAEIRGSIMDLRNSANPRKPGSLEQATVIINTSITKWWNDVEEYLDPTIPNKTPPGKSTRTILVALKHESVIALNRSVLGSSNSSSAYNAALQNCIGAARGVINTLFGALEASPPLLFWPSFTWAVWMSAFIMVFAANEGQVSKDVALHFVDRSAVVLKHLSQRGSSWPDACLVAIRGLKKELKKDSGTVDFNESGRARTEQPLKRKRMAAELSASHDGDDHRPGDTHQVRSQSTRRATEESVHQSWPSNTEAVDTSTQTQQRQSQNVVFPIPDSTWHTATLSRSNQQQNARSNQRAVAIPTAGPNFVASAQIGSSSNAYFSAGYSHGHQAGTYIHNPGVDATFGGMRDYSTTDLFDGSDIPFWLGDDQLMGFDMDYEAWGDETSV
ncbi:hypothetical protein PV08_01100 [Exophiala spinifera]|uniref:Xylanolytic transcriptional activator regulatory domain-containing protein n=1 Tax=Exophiala spinifera TaxID=91928 RepID=A0A0D2BPV4_9EURO|nr:uncharacterized protein PV08_01100 [Exophiala spinifera]KIW20525.1 hypothetical protein PV08_01100 [Exophiala spinifera]